jgi:hypothetical protein
MTDLKTSNQDEFQEESDSRRCIDTCNLVIVRFSAFRKLNISQT